MLSKVKQFLSTLLVFIAFSAFSQTQNPEIKISTNSYDISTNLCVTYSNMTNLLLEKVDKQLFLKSVLLKSDGNVEDKKYFVKYVKSAINKDKEELIYLTGTGTITKVTDVNDYFSSLQAKYSMYYVDFIKNRAEIIESQNTWKSHINGASPAFNCGSPCTNPGFESGTGFWDYSSGVACGTSSSDPCNLVSGFNSTAHELTTTGVYDTQVGGTILPVVPPGGGNNAMELGDYNGTGSKASRASISFTVSAANPIFTYKYAVVLQDPASGHTDPERPYFTVIVSDQSGQSIPCNSLSIMAKPPMTGFIETSPGSFIWYMPWKTVFVPLQAYIGQCVTIEFTVADCSQGGHFGYAYIDADCSTLEITSSSLCTGNVTLTAPPDGIAYDWTNLTTGGTNGIIGASNTQSIIVNQAATYNVSIATGSSCNVNLKTDVTPLPIVTLSPFGVVCDNALPFTLSGGTPYGGIYSGSGVSSDSVFTPGSVTPGLISIIYTYQDINNCSASDTATIQVDVCTGINLNETKNNVSVYPNPAEKNITFVLHESIDLKNTAIFLYDELGKKVMTISHIAGYEIKVESSLLTSGIYFYKINNVNQELAKGKIIIR